MFLQLFVLLTGIAYSQNPPLAPDSLKITEDLQIEQQQKHLDSLIKNRLEKELSQLSGDSKQKQELEKRLQQIEVNDSLRTAEQKQRIEQLRLTATGYPVTLLGDTLFKIYLRLGSFNPAERANAISERMERLYDDEFFNADTVHSVENEATTDIVYQGDMVILSVTDLDALYHNKTRQVLANDYLQLIKSELLQHRKANSLINWAKRFGYALMVILGFFIVIYIVNRLFKLIMRRLIHRKSEYFKGIHFKSYNLFDANEHMRFVVRLLNILKILMILLALYLTLPLLFSIFPQTKNYTHTLLQWIISPAKSVLHSVVDYLPSLFTILVIYLFTRYAIKIVQFFADEVSRGNLAIQGFYSDWAQPTFNIVRFLLYAFMIIVIFPYLPGSGSPAFPGNICFSWVFFFRWDHHRPLRIWLQDWL